MEYLGHAIRGITNIGPYPLVVIFNIFEMQTISSSRTIQMGFTRFTKVRMALIAENMVHQSLAGGKFFPALHPFLGYV